MKLQPIELNIRASWAINCAVATLTEDEKHLPEYSMQEIIFSKASWFLATLDKVKSYIEPPEPPPMCVNCKGIQVYGGTGLNKDGLCANCAVQLSYQARDAKADNQKNRDAQKGPKVGKPII